MHEVAVGIPFRILRGWAFWAMFGQVREGMGRGGGNARVPNRNAHCAARRPPRLRSPTPLRTPTPTIKPTPHSTPNTPDPANHTNGLHPAAAQERLPRWARRVAAYMQPACGTRRPPCLPAAPCASILSPWPLN